MDETSAVPAGSRSPNYGSTAACSPAVREELPDLTEHLKANGIYEETRGCCKGVLQVEYNYKIYKEPRLSLP